MKLKPHISEADAKEAVEEVDQMFREVGTSRPQ